MSFRSLFIALAALFLALFKLTADEASTLAALQKADDERVHATLSADRSRLENILSKHLRYAHSTGTVDSQVSLIESLTSQRIRYESIQYDDRKFELLAPGIALMFGRARVSVKTPDGQIQNALSFLAIWQEENGNWRFRAWQSCQFPPPPTGSKATPNIR